MIGRKRMKKIFIIFLIAIILVVIGIFITKKYNSKSIDIDLPIVYLVEDNLIETTETNKIKIRVNSKDAIGAIEGIVSYNSNIESIDIKSMEEEWTVTYNSKTGKFNAYKASGTKDGDIINIEYKLKNHDEEGKIVISNMEIVTIKYETKMIEELSKTVNTK